MLAAIILHSESVQNAIRREVRRVSELMVDSEVIDKALRDQVLKRDTIEGDQAAVAMKRVLKSSNKSITKASEKDESGEPEKSDDSKEAPPPSGGS